LFIKKLLSLIFVSLLFSGNAYAATLKEDNKGISKEWLKDKTVNELLRNGFGLYQGNGSEITTTEESVQYHLATFLDGKFQMVICFVDVKKTICKLP
jgi:hypothetical protein